MVKWSEGDLCGEELWDGLDCTLLAKVHAESPTTCPPVPLHMAGPDCGANASALNASTNVTTAIADYVTQPLRGTCDGRWTAAAYVNATVPTPDTCPVDPPPLFDYTVVLGVLAAVLLLVRLYTGRHRILARLRAFADACKDRRSRPRHWRRNQNRTALIQRMARGRSAEDITISDIDTACSRVSEVGRFGAVAGIFGGRTPRCPTAAAAARRKPKSSARSSRRRHRRRSSNPSASILFKKPTPLRRRVSAGGALLGGRSARRPHVPHVVSAGRPPHPEPRVGGRRPEYGRGGAARRCGTRDCWR